MTLSPEASKNLTCWQPIETAPKDSHRAIWVAEYGSDRMEPVHDRYGRWVNCYTGAAIAWEPDLWQPLPPSPIPKEPA